MSIGDQEVENELLLSVGNGYKAKKLHRFERRLMEYLRPPEKRQPFVWLITGNDGRRYKLLTVTERNKDKLLRLRKLRYVHDELPFVPAIVAQGDRYILSEYVLGHAPDTSKSAFARMLGKNLAEVHVLGRRQSEVHQFLVEAGNWIQSLANEKLIGPETRSKVEGALTFFAPASVHLCVDYLDLTDKNVVENNEGELYFIDLGGFSFDCIPVESLFRGNILGQRIDMNSFEAAYKESQGHPFYFENRRFIALVATLKNCARYVRILRKRSTYEIRYRKAWRKALNRMLNKLEYLSDAA